jgi:GT2 family glycosyltransferase
MTPSVTVVVVTWNGADLLVRCLDALRRQTYPQLRVLVVDNASADDTVARVTVSYPEVDLRRAPTNLGFAGGNNLALRGLEADYAVLVNNDARPEPDLVASLVAAMERPGWERVGAATARLLLAGRFVRRAGGWQRVDDDPGGVVLVNSTGNVLDRSGFGKDRDWLAVDDGAPAPERVFGFCGAAAILRRAALQDVGLFDEQYFLYYEDTDLSWRLRLAGWDVRHVPGAVAWHEHAASSGEDSPLFRFHNDRNRLLTLVKNAPPALAASQVLRYPLTTASIRLRADDGLLPTRLAAMRSFARLLPHAMRERRASSREARARVARLLVD